MEQYVAHDHDPGDTAERRNCHALWKCSICFHQIDRPIDCQMRTFRPGDRVRGAFDLATVREVRADGRVVVEWDEVDAAGWWRARPAPTAREPWTLNLVAQDTPMAEENAMSKDYRDAACQHARGRQSERSERGTR